MEREILFRGKRLDNGEWTCGSLLTYADGSCFICCEIYPGKLNKLQVDPATVGQYTGLPDKNGKKIFEGDIVKMDSFTPPVKQISFIEGAFCFADKSGEYCADIHYIHHGGKNHATVIGNFWDTPELLEVKK